MATTEKKAAPAAGDVRLYPANTLKDQVREPRATLSAFTVIKAAFFTEK